MILFPLLWIVDALMATLALNIIEIISHKRDRKEWTDEEIRFLIRGISEHSVSEEQLGAVCMAIYLAGMTEAETAAMTLAIADSGEQYAIGSTFPQAIEQSSTGCVGDYGDLALLPLLAACGITIAKVSGPPLGHINSIIGKILAAGTKVDLNREQMIRQLERVGLAVACHSERFTPADRALYATRAVTATVASLPLIASSIMSKKIAVGTTCILVDVKHGNGTFVQHQAQAEHLASVMKGVGTLLGRRMSVPLYCIREPMGLAVGGALEMIQAAAVLQGRGPTDLSEHVLDLGADAILLTGVAAGREQARQRLRAAIADGSALRKLVEWIEAQQGNADFVSRPEALAPSPHSRTVPAPKSGVVQSIDASAIGMAAVRLGAGRERRDDEIDFRAGILLHHKTGVEVSSGEPLATLYTNRKERLEEVSRRVAESFEISA